jgi:hypothetical protein
MIVNHPKIEIARQVMNRLKRINILTVEIIRKIWDRLNARKLITIYRKRLFVQLHSSCAGHVRCHMTAHTTVKLPRHFHVASPD